MVVVVSSETEYGERYEEKELLGEGGFGKVNSSYCKQMMVMMIMIMMGMLMKIMMMVMMIMRMILNKIMMMAQTRIGKLVKSSFGKVTSSESKC